jgi:hypothetical protein
MFIKNKKQIIWIIYFVRTLNNWQELKLKRPDIIGSDSLAQIFAQNWSINSEMNFCRLKV